MSAVSVEVAAFLQFFISRSFAAFQSIFGAIPISIARSGEQQSPFLTAYAGHEPRMRIATAIGYESLFSRIT
ncbi:hypothetical protein [Dyella caseinilytica]|uniref:Uncharacterized protein n=1 Tax=Dyella caseinilytica TaxID=1849581 RepID=A0ABX7GTR3_9GAMM|nr:hypothetical protein [Dyella caseinilytica]QRN53845.1 hypothetical protein ISN74_00010 [Dyella caseinilytica]